MNKENWAYLAAFLFGVVAVNFFGSAAWAKNSLLNQYNLENVTFRQINYNEYMIQILLLRFQTVIVLWGVSKLIPKKAVAVGFGVIMCGLFGAVIAMAILANGIWGILFCFGAMLPHGIFYGMSYLFWSNQKKSTPLSGILILMLMVVGCICEAYVCPYLVEYIIKF